MLGTRLFGRDPLGGGRTGPPLGATGSSGLAPTDLVLQIGATDATPYLFVDSWRLSEQLNGRDDAQCRLIVNDGTGFVPRVGDSFILTINNARQFAGTVHERDVQWLADVDGMPVVIDVRAVDHNELADRRMIVEIFQNMTVGAIARSIVSDYLSLDDVTVGDIQDGPLVSKMVCGYMTAAQVFDELTLKSGMHWNIDEFKALSLAARTTVPAPFTLTAANAVFRNLKGTKSRNQYRNVQFIDGGKGLTDQRTEIKRGDTTQRTFSVEYELNSAPTIRRNNVVQTVGIRGVDTGRQWYWNKGEKEIGQDQSEVPLAPNNDLLSVTYIGQYDVVAIVEDSAAIAERQSVQGGSGRYEALDTDDSLDGAQRIQDKAVSLLRHYASIDEVVELDTYTPGLAIGQLVQLDAPELGLSGSYLITALETTSLAVEHRSFHVTATTGELKGTFEELFKSLLARDQGITIRENDIVQEVFSMRDPVGVSDSISATLYPAQDIDNEWGTGNTGFAEFGG